MNANPNSTPEHSDGDRRCPACSSTSLTQGRISGRERDHVDLFACDDCGDFWFERSGTRLTAEAMRQLGLNA